MKGIGISPAFDETPNPINWIQNWTESKKVQNAPQETEIESYKIGSYDQDIGKTHVDEFKF